MRLLDLEHGGWVGGLRPHVDAPYFVGFDARAERLVSCSTDKSIALSDTRPLRERLRARDAALALRAGVEPTLRARLDAGASVAALADEACAADTASSADQRATWGRAPDRARRRAPASRPP